ncbi:hypothetical protein RAB80_018313 [Fusarium oxysporum f. sp. vasinfectum]|nr:hypothetical protein RAB80_018313 [Fusarium oxysporum f. sp. vasinfectum]
MSRRLVHQTRPRQLDGTAQRTSVTGSSRARRPRTKWVPLLDSALKGINNRKGSKGEGGYGKVREGYDDTR